ncbi:MAG: ATP-binding protein, partial [Desulfobacterales bacterium]|nr:ATP-binding protein [Desulfobacterales bacterium]
MRKRRSIRAKLFALFSIIFIASMVFLTYMATRIVIQFGEYSAAENEAGIKSQASFFLTQVTHEKAMRCENIFERIAVSSAFLARQAAINLDKETILGKAPFKKEDILVKAQGSHLYSNHPEDPVMVLYWGEKRLHKGIISHLNTLSHMDPLLKNVIDRNPEAVACFVTFEKATTRYYPNFPSIIRSLPADAYEVRDSAWYTAVKPVNNPDGNTVWSDVYQDPAGRGLMTTAVSPVYDVNGAFIGAAGVDVTLENITDKILGSTEKGHTSGTKELFSFIIDARGRIVAFPGRYLALFGFENIPQGRQIGYNALFNLKMSDSTNENVKKLWHRNTLDNRPSLERIRARDKQLLISSFIMPSTGWRLGVAVPETNLLESIQETRTAMTSMVNTMVLKFGSFVLLIMCVSIIGFAFLSFKYFIQPLDTLTRAAVRVKDGDLSLQVGIYREDEIGILARTFNTMVTELRKLSLKEKEHAKQLQQKVRERTIELEEKTLQQEKTLDRLQQEIRERKQVEHRLIRSEEKYRDIFNNSVQGIFQSSQDNRILNANPSMARILGYDSIEEFVSTIKNLAQQVYVDPAQREAFIALLRENDFVSGFETQLKKKDGSHVWVSICGRAVRDEVGELRHIQGSFEDISERKKAQQIFKRAKQMAEEASRAKGEFLTIMSHEIRTPLNAIIGMTRLTMTTALTHTQKEYLDAVLISSDHLLTLLNNILDFSKIEAGKFILEKKAFDIDSLLNDMLTMFSFQARKKQLDLQYTTGDIPHYVTGDIHRLRQILVNLVGNAIKFTNSGDIAIDVNVPESEPGTHSRDDVVLLFSIKDTGVGIPSDKLAAVFNDFTQLNDTGAIEPGGTGLGLTITRQLIHLMDGDIWVESENGKGSTFYFRIRLKKATE